MEKGLNRRVLEAQKAVAGCYGTRRRIPKSTHVPGALLQKNKTVVRRDELIEVKRGATGGI